MLNGPGRRNDPLIERLPVQPGQKEARFAQLLSSEFDIEAFAVDQATRTTRSSVDAERVEKLEEEVTSLRVEVEELKQTFQEFKKQFE